VLNATPLAVASNNPPHTDSRDPWSTGAKYVPSKPLFPDPAEQIHLTGPQIAVNFIKGMFGPTTEMPVHFCSLGNERDGKHSPRTLITRNPDEVASFIKKFDLAERGLFYCVSTLKPGLEKRNKENIAETSMLHADIDLKDVSETVDEIIEKLKLLKYPPSAIVASGNGVHAYWLLTECIINPFESGEMDRIEADLRQLADLIGGDLSVCEIARVMRLPGSHNSKKGVWKPVEVIEFTGKRYHLDDLEEWLAEASPVILRKARERAVTAGQFDGFDQMLLEGEFKPRVDIEARLKAMMFMGGRDAAIHATQLSVSAAMLNAGHSVSEVVGVLLATTKSAAGDYGKRWNWRREEKTIEDMCATWLEKHPPKFRNGPAHDRGGNIIPFDNGRNTNSAAPPPEIYWHGNSYERATRSWLIENLIPETGQGLASGQWGAGKTFAVLDLAASVMTGTPFAGREVGRRGGVVFIAAEGASEIPIRLEGVVNHKLRPNSSVVVNLDNLPFAWIEECPSLKEEASFERLVAIVLDAAAQMKGRFNVDLALIVIDTLSASADFADANDAAEGQRIMNRLNALSRRTGAFVLAVDHFGKSTETGTRGSSAKEAAADVVLAILADRDVGGTVSKTRMAVRKLRGGSTGAETPFDLKVVDLGFNQTTCVIEWKPDLAPPANGQGTSKRNPWQGLKVLRSALGTALAEHGEKMRPFGYDGPYVLAVALDFVRKEFMASYPAAGDTDKQKGDAKRKAFQRHLKSARDKSLVCSRDINGDDQIWLAGDDD
jgi:hypothetical protein